MRNIPLAFIILTESTSISSDPIAQSCVWLCRCIYISLANLVDLYKQLMVSYYLDRQTDGQMVVKVQKMNDVCNLYINTSLNYDSIVLDDTLLAPKSVVCFDSDSGARSECTVLI